MAINIQKTFYKVVDFVNWQRNGQLRLSPEFQRRSVWKSGAKSYLIDTIIKGMPIPIIFLRDKRLNIEQFEPIREVVDGQQRLRTVLSFVCPEYLSDYDIGRDDFTIKKAHNSTLAGKKFKDLDAESKRQILDYEFDAHILPSRIDDREIIQIFRRMNSTSFTVNKQELRNSEFFGEFKTSVYELAAEQLQRWRKWKTFTEDNISRMFEVEMSSECMQIILEGKIFGRSPSQLDKLYEKYDEIFDERKEVEKRFREVMDVIYDNLNGDNGEFVLLKRTLFYTLFAFIYFTIYGFQTIKQEAQAKAFDVEKQGKLKLANERLKNRSAPINVLEATDRRTTNLKERKDLFEYLKKSVSDGTAK
jgi:hypothetical protein